MDELIRFTLKLVAGLSLLGGFFWLIWLAESARERARKTAARAEPGNRIDVLA
jgi:hypothetical protein